MERETRFSVGGMHCISCADVIKKALEKKKGIIRCDVQFANERAAVLYNPKEINESEIKAAVHETGYEVQDEHAGHQHPPLFSDFIIALLLSLPFLLAMLFNEAIPPRIQLMLATIVQFWSGRSFYRSSFFALKVGAANMDSLIALGTSAAYLYSLFSLLSGVRHLYFESSVLIITLVLLGRVLEQRSKRRASEALEKLLALGPKEATIKRGEQFITVPIAQIVLGDLIRVRPGDLIAVDGTVVEGESAVSEASITGESIPVLKTVGSYLFSGTTNLNGSLLIRAEAVGEETVAKRMAKIVEHAQSSRAPIQSLADKIAEWFVPAVILISTLTFLGWFLYSHQWDSALMPAIAVLVIACPCALGLATPTVIVVASGKGAGQGILFREARAIEEAEKLQTLIVDKTGTLTEGSPTVLSVETSGISKEEALTIAASLAHHSTHPLSKAIVEHAEREGAPIEPIQDFVSTPGKGVRGIKRGRELFLGSLAFAKEIGVPLTENEKAAVLLFDREKILALFIIMDPVRSTSKEAVEKLKKWGIKVVMVTGDRPEVGERVAREVGIDEVIAGVLPEKKAEIVASYKNKSAKVGMVGDGINDAPALAVADVSFAIGSGSDIAIETADVTLIKGDLKGAVKAIALSRRSVRTIKENLFFAFIYNILGIPLAAFGLLSPVIAAAAMAMSSISVVLNALRLYRSQQLNSYLSCVKAPAIERS